MTITARNAHSQLTTTSTLLAGISLRVAQGVGAVTQQIDAGGVGDGREDAGVRGKNWITDPTGESAVNRVDNTERYLEDVEQHIATIRLSVAKLVAWCDDHAPIGVEHPRCHGGRTVEDWSRPDCTNFVAYQVRADGSISYRGDGLCDRCRQAKARHERRDDAA